MRNGEAVIPTLRFSTLEIDHTEYRLAFTYRAILIAESAANCRLLTGMDAGIDASRLRGLLYAAVTPFDSLATLQLASALIRIDTAARIQAALYDAYRLSMERPEHTQRDAAKKIRTGNLKNQQLWDDSWSQARVHLGLSDDEFLDLTPRQLHLLLDQYRAHVEHQELISGIVAANIVNWSTHRTKKRARPIDFMPSRAGREEKEKAPRINRKKIADKVRAFFDNNPHG